VRDDGWPREGEEELEVEEGELVGKDQRAKGIEGISQYKGSQSPS